MFIIAMCARAIYLITELLDGLFYQKIIDMCNQCPDRDECNASGGRTLVGWNQGQSCVLNQTFEASPSVIGQMLFCSAPREPDPTAGVAAVWTIMSTSYGA